MTADYVEARLIPRTAEPVLSKRDASITRLGDIFAADFSAVRSSDAAPEPARLVETVAGRVEINDRRRIVAAA